MIKMFVLAAFFAIFLIRPKGCSDARTFCHLSGSKGWKVPPVINNNYVLLVPTWPPTASRIPSLSSSLQT